MRGKGVYLREGSGQYGEPFEHREDAEGFIELMESFGESFDGIHIVEMGDDVDTQADPQTCP